MILNPSNLLLLTCWDEPRPNPQRAEIAMEAGKWSMDFSPEVEGSILVLFHYYLPFSRTWQGEGGFREMLRLSLEMVLTQVQQQVVPWWDALGFHPRKPHEKRSLGTSRDGCVEVSIQGRKKWKTAGMSRVFLEAREEEKLKKQTQTYFQFLHYEKQQGQQEHG